MVKNDHNNILLASDQSTVDQINSVFYSRFNYPWYPREFPVLTDRDFWRKCLCQDIGDWTLSRMPEKMKIWVAGCGTNQAVFTALRYPNAEVIGTDVSAKSIEVCRNTAKQLNVANLVLEKRSINDSLFQDEFDYVICTGVIHHNAHPEVTLKLLRRALAKNGILELMVYNFYHRIITTAFQKAIHIISGSGKKMDTDLEYIIALQLMRNFPVDNLVKSYIASLDKQEESLIADALIQPVEHSFTVESLSGLADVCGLELLYHCVNQFDVAENRVTWNLDISDDNYNSLSDIDRWQASNLLMLEKSPMLWFYLQRDDSDCIRYSEEEMCGRFIENRFCKLDTVKHCFSLKGLGEYEEILNPVAFPIPGKPVRRNALKVFDALDPTLTLKETLTKIGLSPDFQTVNDLRIHLATSAFPYVVVKS